MMDKKIKFRGKDIDTNKWVYGSLIIDDVRDKYFIIISVANEEIDEEEFLSVAYYEVKKETVGQYTNLKDKNSKEIYKGDIAVINGHKFLVQYEIGSFMLVRCSEKTNMYKQFKNCWNDDVYSLSQFYWENDCEENIIYEIEVIGNKEENPEWLK